MGQARVIKLRGGTLYKGDQRIQGIAVGSIAIPGILAAQIDISPQNVEERQFISDLDNPGACTFQLIFNPADPLHKKMYDEQGEDIESTYKWIVSGKIVGGFATNDSREIGKLSVVSVSAGAGEQTLVYSKHTAEEPKEGDILEHGVNEDLKIKSREPGEKKYKVTKLPAGAIAAVAAATDYNVKIPAVAFTFSGRVTGIPITGGGVALTCAVSIQINSKPDIVIGTPNLA